MNTHVINDLSDKRLNSNKFSSIYASIVAQQNTHNQQFYLTGYEGLFTDADRRFMVESVLSSVIPFDGKVIVVATPNSDMHVADVCRSFDIPFTVIEETNCEAIIENILATDRQYGHIFTSSNFDAVEIQKLGKLCRKYRRNLIVDCQQGVISVQDMSEIGIDYMIANDCDDKQTGSLLIARRS